MKMKAQELLRIVDRCEGDYLEESCDFLGRDLRTGHPLPDLTYVNLHGAPMTGTSIAESLIVLFCRRLHAEPRFQLIYLKSDITRYWGFGLVL